MEFRESFSMITPEVTQLSKLCNDNGKIEPGLYEKYNVKRGLRDLDGKGVLTGLTEISEIISKKKDENGNEIPCDGILRYRGYNVEDIISGISPDSNFGFEEVVYLLLFGQLPTQQQLSDFIRLQASNRILPTGFVRDIIMKAPSKDMMNALARSVLTLYAYDNNADDTSIPNVLRQCLKLIALFPQLSVYGYQTYKYYHDEDSLIIHAPDPELSTAENILRMLRSDSKFTPLEAKVLDTALILHAEHGGGNNSTFTTHVVTSSGTDTYSAVTAALGSLRGPKHGGANIKVVHMFDDIKAHVADWNDDDELSAYLMRILNKDAFDNSGLIYGVGHAIYSLSDPRARMLKGYVADLSHAKGLDDEYKLYTSVERLAPQVIAEHRKMFKGVSANVDFYSGFAYSMLGLPTELYTPIFAIARIAGWSAHRIEELINAGKIIRPAYLNVQQQREYKDIDKR
jgi:citrate synthase